jgi:hypothetical protein
MTNAGGDLPSQHRELMAKNQNLDVFGPIGPAEQNQPAEKPDEDQIQQSKSHKTRSCRPDGGMSAER